MRQIDYKREQICQFRLRADLSGPAKAIAVHLYDRDGPGGAFPTLAELGAVTGHKERMTRYHVRELEAAGVVVVEYNAGGNAKTPANRRPNLYTVDLLAVGVQSIAPQDDAVGVQSIAPQTGSRGAICDTSGGQPIAAKRQKRTTESKKSSSYLRAVPPLPDEEGEDVFAKRVCAIVAEHRRHSRPSAAGPINDLRSWTDTVNRRTMDEWGRTINKMRGNGSSVLTVASKICGTQRDAIDAARRLGVYDEPPPPPPAPYEPPAPIVSYKQAIANGQVTHARLVGRAAR